jgi:predicted PurR-regulated permease PerM
VTALFVAGVAILWQAHRILFWVAIAIFFAVVLNRPVRFLIGRGLRRGVAVLVVVLTLFLVVGALGYAFVRPLGTQAVEFATNLPETVDRIRNAPGVRDVLHRLHIENRVEQVSRDLPNRLLGLTGPVLSAFRTIGEVLVATLTIFVMTVFLLLYGPGFAEVGLELIKDPERKARVERVGERSMQAISGWVAGNLMTSVVAALASLIAFMLLGLPYSVLLALWVGVADLIPLVGAILGAIPAIVIAFMHSMTAGIVVVVFLVAYQQFENHVLAPAVYGRTIQLNPFLVLFAALVGVELAGFVGALLALPVAGTIQIGIGEWIDHRRHRLAATPAQASELLTAEAEASSEGRSPPEGAGSGGVIVAVSRPESREARKAGSAPDT